MKRLFPQIGAVLLCSISLLSFAQSSEMTEIQEYLLENNAKLNRNDVQNIVTNSKHTSKHNGITHLYASQSLNGIRVANSSLTTAFDQEGNLRYATGNFFPNLSAASSSPSLSLGDAVLSQLQNDIPNLQVTVEKGESNKADITLVGGTFQHSGKAELVYFMTAEKQLKLAWSFDCELPSGDHWYHYTVDAIDGSLLDRIDWMTTCNVNHLGTGSAIPHTHAPKVDDAPFSPLDGSGYRVFELPIESPNHGSRTLLAQPADAIASPFGWHDTDGSEGPEFTITRGNNVYAYDDIDDNNIPGFSPDGGSELLFDFSYDSGQLPENYLAASTTNLFYVNNRIHDILFSYGFDEGAGNFQATNYSNEGLDGDFVNAECQDGQGFNNANMATPPDGNNPRMQMFLWQAGQVSDFFIVNSPSSLAGSYDASNLSTFGAGVPPGGITADLALFLDNSGESDGCEPAVNQEELVGKIAILRRGGCNFDAKVIAAEDAGAVACIIVNNAGGLTNPGGGTPGSVGIPSFMILQSAGEELIAALENGETINANIEDTSGENFIDGSFDNGVVVHEYVHGLTNRLTGGSSTSGCLGNEEQMGEGWSDWYAIMLTIDINSENPTRRPMGTFASDEEIDGNGIRPLPYDTNFVANDYTYADIGNNEISQPHGVGFVWSTMLWDLTWAFINEYGYDDDIVNGTAGNNISLQLITDALKLQPCSPGFVDGRDAILAADELTNDGVNQCLIWKVFARRGLGYSADQGSTDSRFDGTAAFDLPPACFNITSAPSAGFSVSNAVTCNGIVEFTDESQDQPQSWSWDFGDGETSIEQNPTHIYEEEGVYTVSLTVTNTLGEDILTQTNLIDYSTPDAPQTVGAEGCAGEIVTLSATSGDGSTIFWTDQDDNVVGEGNDLEVMLGNQSASYFAQVELNPQAPSFVGPENENFGTGGNHATTFIGTVDFETFQPLTIQSVYVNSGATGTRIISLWEGNSDGELIDQVVVDIDFIGGDRIQLDLDIDVPGQYSIGLDQANLYRNDSGANYPYTTPGLISINGSSAGSDFYYYFYDFEVSPDRCISEATEAMAEVTAGSTFTSELSGLTVSFTALGSSTSWNWDFGDGNSSSDQNPTHTYAENGVYEVTLTTDSDCEFTESIEVIVTGIEDYESGDIRIHPNPASEFLIVKNEGDVKIDRLMIHDIQGRVIMSQSVIEGPQWRINISNIPTGVYSLTLLSIDDLPVHRQKLVITH